MAAYINKMGVSKNVLYGLGGVLVVGLIVYVIYRHPGSSGAKYGGSPAPVVGDVSWPAL